MMERMLTGWSFTRVVYILMGSYLAIQAISEEHWAFVPLGLYFASMGLFAFGCAAGNCYTAPNQTTITGSVNDVSYEEITSNK